MSQTSNRTKLAALVSEKLAKLRTKIADSATADDKLATYDQFNLFFSGLSAGADALGVTDDDRAPVEKATAYINSNMAALEAEIDLEGALA